MESLNNQPLTGRFDRYILSMSHAAIDDAYDAYQQCAEEWKKIADERNALQPIDRNYVGFAGVQKRQKELAEFTSREEAASAAARDKVKKHGKNSSLMWNHRYLQQQRNLKNARIP